jgi:hypothetical protein
MFGRTRFDLYFFQSGLLATAGETKKASAQETTGFGSRIEAFPKKKQKICISRGEKYTQLVYYGVPHNW